MAVQAPQKTGYEKWQEGINSAVGNAKWNFYDCAIQMTVNQYNRHLSGTARYRPLDWRLIKAMIWVETGAESKKWESNPIQIGNPGDPGLRVLLAGNEGGDLIIPPTWMNRLTFGSAITNPYHNIAAGIGYLLMRTANYAIKNVPDADATIYEARVLSGDSIAKIAKTNGSTIEVIQKLNPSFHLLRPGQVLKYQKASLKKVIVSWKIITTSSIAKNYNSGDSLYPQKLDYALSLIHKGEAALCAQ
ncbi:LysM peptidoglycan-binding domain-containing protein [Paraburkholderia sp. JPY419]|uniref:LysM peptidoglycan-binding domain-containing protein n=1 Tax=Paraburkholderia sp. JPY419 TaxID=667660 RepID=UPI003D1CD8B3